MTPAAVGRAVLGVAVISAILLFAAGTWPALLPFAVGGLLAYAVLPVVDSLDRIMPRALAAAISMLAVVASVVMVFVIVVPPLTTAIVDLAGQVPTAGEIDELLDDALAGLPDSAQAIVGPILIEIAAAVEGVLAGASGGLGEIVPVVLQAALGVVGAIIGLIVLPTWLLTLLTNKRRGRVAVDRVVAGWMRPDFWAVVRMADRAAGTYLRGYVVLAAAVGLLTWIGLTASPQLGGPEFRGALALGVLAGAVQVVPELGPILGFLPALLLLAYDPQRAITYIGVYLVARLLSGWLVGGRLDSRLHVHPAILIPGVVVLSQVGLLWLLLSAPILAFGSDLVRYLHGRLSEPPRPAGLLPDEPVPVVRTASPARVPSVYRRRAVAPEPTGAAPAATPAIATPTAAR